MNSYRSVQILYSSCMKNWHKSKFKVHNLIFHLFKDISFLCQKIIEIDIPVNYGKMLQMKIISFLFSFQRQYLLYSFLTALIIFSNKKFVNAETLV